MDKKTVLLFVVRKQLSFHDRITKFINKDFLMLLLNRRLPLLIKIKVTSYSMK